MTSATPIQPAASDNEGRPESFVQRRPVTAFLLLAFGIGWPGLGIPLIMGLPAAPFLLLLVFVALLDSALLVTRLADGPGAVRTLLSRVLIWRFSVGALGRHPARNACAGGGARRGFRNPPQQP